MSDQVSPYPGYAPAKAYAPPEPDCEPSTTAEVEFFKTKDCADDDTSMPEFRKLLLEAVAEMSPGDREPMPAPQVDVRKEELTRDGLESRLSPEASASDGIITASTPFASQSKPQRSSASLQIPGWVQAAHLQKKQMLLAQRQQPTQRLVPRIVQRGHGGPAQSQPAQVHKPFFSPAPVSKGAGHLAQIQATKAQKFFSPPAPVLIGSSHGHWLIQYQSHHRNTCLQARAARFIQKNPCLDRPYTTSVGDVIQVLKLAQERQDFELEKHFWSSLQLVGEKFSALHPQDNSPFACAVRYARAPFVNGEIWCDIDVHVKKILRDKLDATGRILLRELDMDYMCRAMITPAVSPEIYMVIEHAQHPSQRQIDWTDQDINALVELLCGTQSQAQA